MTLEIGLLALETILLVATLMLLVYSIREGKQRDKLLLEMGKATKILTRQEYFLTVLDSMLGAQEEIVGCITGRIPAGDDKQMTRDIFSTIESIEKKNANMK